jgi:hypothetical protein
LLPKRCSLEELFNKPGHGLNQNQLVACLGGLFRNGLIEMSTFSGEQPWAPTDDQIAAAVVSAKSRDEPSLAYGLTDKGGATWEAFAAPKWDRFILEDFDDDTRTSTVSCAIRLRLERYLNYFKLNLLDQAIAPDTVQIQELGEWQATYWKKLPHGFCARFVNTFTERHFSADKLEWLAFCGLCDFRDGWYRWR